jgi:hypothetical protein
MEQLDKDWFKDKDCSSYAVMFEFLNYLVNELRDTSLRVKFGHWDYSNIEGALESSTKLNTITFDAHRYLSEVLKTLDGL